MRRCWGGRRAGRRRVCSTTSTSASFAGLLFAKVADLGLGYSEQEHLRDHESSHADGRTEHEIYVHPSMRAVQAGVASVMCSYSTYFHRPTDFAREMLTSCTRPSERDLGMRERPHPEPDPQGRARLPGLRHVRLGRAPLNLRRRCWSRCTFVSVRASCYGRMVLVGTTRRCRCLALSCSTRAPVGGART